MPITYDEAYANTNPALPPETRDKSALAIMAGIAANDIYWQHTDTITALKARAQGAGQVITDHTKPDETDNTDAIEGTEVTDVPALPAEHHASTVPTPSTAPSPQANLASNNPQQAIAVLRKQLEDAGVTPDA